VKLDDELANALWKVIAARLPEGATFALAICHGSQGPDTGFWLGFDCLHGGDLYDVDLFEDPYLKEFYRDYNERMASIHVGGYSMPMSVKSTDYVRAECKSLALQAKQAACA